MDYKNIIFKDTLEYDSQTKTAISVRDGVQEYYGIELGLEPVDKIFKVYRSPATIANTANSMINLPLTDDHIELTKNDFTPIGKVLDSTMIDLPDDSKKSTLAIKNIIELNKNLTNVLENGKKELSLGYKADLIDHDIYDFEQKNIIPHHLAVVEFARGGDELRFLDKRGVKMNLKDKLKSLKNKFKDEDAIVSENENKNEIDSDTEVSTESNPTLEKIVEISTKLPEALKLVPIDKLQEILPILQDIIDIAENNDNNQDGDNQDDDNVDNLKDKDVTDSKKFKILEFTNKKFQDAIEKQIMLHNSVIDKAKYYLDDNYNFSGKTTKQIMRDAIKSQTKEYFDDRELKIAFKMLANPAQKKYATFGDSGNINKNSFLNLIEKGEK